MLPLYLSCDPLKWPLTSLFPVGNQCLSKCRGGGFLLWCKQWRPTGAEPRRGFPGDGRGPCSLSPALTLSAGMLPWASLRFLFFADLLYCAHSWLLPSHPHPTPDSSYRALQASTAGTGGRSLPYTCQHSSRFVPQILEVESD